MKWTTDKPTTPGWYWVNFHGHREIVKLYQCGDRLAWGDDENDPLSLVEFLEFAGPIPEPTRT